MEGKKAAPLGIVIGLILMWAISLYAYYAAPSTIPTHYGINGKPDEYGSKNIFLWLPSIFSIAPIIFLLIWKYRFNLIEKHPYLINLPAFFSIILNLPENEKKEYINRYFEYLLLLGVAITFALVILNAAICMGAIEERMPSYLILFSILLIFIPIPILILYLRKMAYEVKTKTI